MPPPPEEIIVWNTGYTPCPIIGAPIVFFLREGVRILKFATLSERSVTLRVQGEIFIF